MAYRFFFLFLLLGQTLFAEGLFADNPPPIKTDPKKPDPKEKVAKPAPLTTPPTPPTPWLTGPLIVPVSVVIPLGQFEAQSYVYCTTNTGVYNQHWKAVSAEHNLFSLNPQLQLYVGLTPWMDINITTGFLFNRSHRQSSVNYADLQIALEFQLLAPDATPYFPGIKFLVRETFPTGTFEQLNPHKLLTDIGGAGTFGTSVGLILYEVYHFTGHHFLTTTYSAAYTVASPVHVHGFNQYGGGYGTNGRALPGNTFQGIISFEFTLSQNWVLAIDNVYQHVDRTQFYGRAGTTEDDLASSVGSPSSEQISFAPAIEYNFSSPFGIIVGCWFTAWGRNSTQFRSGVINFDYTY